MSAEVKIPFFIYGIPDSSGLRIKAKQPFGVYVSSMYPESAKFYFLGMILRIVSEKDMLVPKVGEGLNVSLINWDACLETGFGEVVIRIAAPEDAKQTEETGTPVTVPKNEELLVNKFVESRGDEIYIIRDNSVDIDGWIVHAIEEDFHIKN